MSASFFQNRVDVSAGQNFFDIGSNQHVLDVVRNFAEAVVDTRRDNDDVSGFDRSGQLGFDERRVVAGTNHGGDEFVVGWNRPHVGNFPAADERAAAGDHVVD